MSYKTVLLGSDDVINIRCTNTTRKIVVRSRGVVAIVTDSDIVQLLFVSTRAIERIDPVVIQTNATLVLGDIQGDEGRPG